MEVMQCCTAASLTYAEIATAAVSEALRNLACNNMQQGSMSQQHLQKCHLLLLSLCCCCSCCVSELHTTQVTVTDLQFAVYNINFRFAMQVMQQAKLQVSPPVLVWKQ